ncbi:hypothetical protein IEQ34_012358 [Dendrobium chrysotoxum]|uniref:DUF4283 domain-containing protein n=1 Tax=Dendrobium chrysotoxum TaxID=161865 RepID=A0AAV7GVH3_DENCH|nr:hypothetical protein IEQ34_012358 [Dendrobium chrysotoxum]
MAKPVGFFDVSRNGNSWSFKEVVTGGSSSSSPKSDLFQTSFKGVSTLMNDENVISQLVAPFEFMLVRKFVLYWPNHDIIHKLFVSFKLSEIFFYLAFGSTAITIYFREELIIFNLYQMCLLKWTPFFDIKEEFPIASVWMSFPYLRLHMFDSQILFALASIYGRPLQMDQATTSISYQSITRILVEKVVSKKYPKKICLGPQQCGYFEKVEFENFPIFLITVECLVTMLWNVSFCILTSTNKKILLKNELQSATKSNLNQLGPSHEPSHIMNGHIDIGGVGDLDHAKMLKNIHDNFLGDFSKSIVRKDSGSLPHLEGEKDDGSLPHLESEKDDGSLPHLESEKDDGSLSHLEGEKDDGTLPHRGWWKRVCKGFSALLWGQKESHLVLV